MTIFDTLNTLKGIMEFITKVVTTADKVIDFIIQNVKKG